MKLKKKVKRTILIIVIILLVILLSYVGYKLYNKMTGKEEITEVKIINKIEKYGYNLKETKSPKYKSMFNELKGILNEKEIDEEKYAKKIVEMFIYDFYSLNDKNSKSDVGGVDFIYADALDNFLVNAEDTYYKYVESNIYNNRNQNLPEVDEINISNINKQSFTYLDKTDENAYVINVSWTYTSEEFSKYQKDAIIVLIHDNEKLSIIQSK